MDYGINFRAMGCQMQAWLSPSESVDPNILSQVPNWLEELEASFSRFRPESELSHLNASAGALGRNQCPLVSGTRSRLECSSTQRRIV